MQRYSEGYRQKSAFRDTAFTSREEFSWALSNSLEYLIGQNDELMAGLAAEEKGLDGYGFSPAQLEIVTREYLIRKTSHYHGHNPSRAEKYVDMYETADQLTYLAPKAKGTTNKLPIKKVHLREEPHITLDYASRHERKNIDYIALPLIHKLTAEFTIDSWGNQLNNPLFATLTETVSHAIEKGHRGPNIIYSAAITLELDNKSQTILSDYQQTHGTHHGLLATFSLKPGKQRRSHNPGGSDEQAGGFYPDKHGQG